MVNEIKVARSLAPEDIKPGIYVMHLATYCEYARWPCEPDATVQVTKVRWTPENGQRPGRVVAVCLPFVLIENEKGDTTMCDTRRMSLARVKRSFAELVWARARQSAERAQREQSEPGDPTAQAARG